MKVMSAGISGWVGGKMPTESGLSMFDHLGMGVTDMEASTAFYVAALAPIDVKVVGGLRRCGRSRYRHQTWLWLSKASTKPMPLHIAFTATKRSQVDEFYERAIAAGGKDNGAPGIRAHYHPNYYGAFVFGPDGHNIEVVCHSPE